MSLFVDLRTKVIRFFYVANKMEIVFMWIVLFEEYNIVMYNLVIVTPNNAHIVFIPRGCAGAD